MVGPRAWLLNLDADDELALPGSTPSRAIRERTRALVPRLGALVPAGDLVLDEEALEGGVARGLSGRAFCPTPRALALLARAGAELSPAPSFEVLRRVNHRLFCAELGQTLPHARYAKSLDEVSAALAQSSPSGVWILKRPHGFAGRGRRRVVSPLDAGARDFVLATLRRWGGLQIEPWVERRGDFGLHGHLDAKGGLVLGEPTRQENDDAGAWVATVRATPGDLTPDEQAALARATEEAARALTSAGYFGPFGVDAFRWEDEGGACRFNARCEVNARYTMGWAVGMGERRPDL
jgi:hypothetical protein